MVAGSCPDNGRHAERSKRLGVFIAVAAELHADAASLAVAANDRNELRGTLSDRERPDAIVVANAAACVVCACGECLGVHGVSCVCGGLLHTTIIGTQ